MPPDRTTRPSTKPFKPPRPSSNSQQPSKSQSTSSRPSGSFARPSAAQSSRPTDTQSPLDELPPSQESPSSDRAATIPPQLLTRLLHEFFQNDKTRINRSADRAVGKYMETFVKEAIARAVFERGLEEEKGGMAEGFLEVEDLEKLAPQLVLDF